MFQPAFTVVTTWASNAEEFREKCLRMLESYGWKLIVVERANPVPDDGEFSKEVEDMLERTRSNPNAIIYGTFYSYPTLAGFMCRGAKGGRRWLAILRHETLRAS